MYYYNIHFTSDIAVFKDKLHTIYTNLYILGKMFGLHNNFSASNSDLQCFF